MARVKLLGYLVEKNGFTEKNIDVEDGTAISSLPLDVDWDRVVITVNGRPAKPSTKIKNEDRVVIMPVIGGGL